MYSQSSPFVGVLRVAHLPVVTHYPVAYVNVAYGIPKYTATRNNRLLVISCLATSLLFRLAVHFGSPYPPLMGEPCSTLTKKCYFEY